MSQLTSFAVVVVLVLLLLLWESSAVFESYQQVEKCNAANVKLTRSIVAMEKETRENNAVLIKKISQLEKELVSSKSFNLLNEEPFLTVGRKTGTDKVSPVSPANINLDIVHPHSYQYLYSKYLPYVLAHPNKRFLEIGLGCGMPQGVGNGARMWRQLLQGIEINTAEWNQTCIDWWGPLNKDVIEPGHLVQVDQGSVESLVGMMKKLKGDTDPFSMIIDDGGHTMKQQLTSLLLLFPAVAPGGVYVLEDLVAAFIGNPYLDLPKEYRVTDFIGSLFRTWVTPDFFPPKDYHKDPPFQEFLLSFDCQKGMCVFVRNQKPAHFYTSLTYPAQPPLQLPLEGVRKEDISSIVPSQQALTGENEKQRVPTQQAAVLKLLPAWKTEGGVQEKLSPFCELLSSQNFKYNKNLPNFQSVVDMLTPWYSVLPNVPATGEQLVSGGISPLFDDLRIRWIMSQIEVRGMHIFEMGPLEGGHSYMLSQAGASVTSVEGSPLGYIKSMFTKMLYQSLSITPLFGNFEAMLQKSIQSKIKFDMALCAGVLHHMEDPMQLLHLISQAADSVSIWTHYYHPDRRNQTAYFWESLDQTRNVTVGGYTHPLYCHVYRNRSGVGHIGGSGARTCWLTKEDLIGGLKHFGFKHVMEMKDPSELTHPHGAQIMLVASRNPVKR